MSPGADPEPVAPPAALPPDRFRWITDPLDHWAAAAPERTTWRAGLARTCSRAARAPTAWSVTSRIPRAMPVRRRA